MIFLTIAIKGKGTNGAELKNGLHSKPASDILSRRFREAGSDIRAALIKEAPRDTGGLANAHGYAYDKGALKLVVFNRKDYALYAHEGRKPGKMPPVEALIPWCRRHIVNARITRNLRAARFQKNSRYGGSRGSSSYRSNRASAMKGLAKPGGIRAVATKGEQQEARSMAFLVARAIGRRGTKPNRWFDRVLETMAMPRIQRCMNEVSEDLSKVLGGAMVSVVTESTKGITGYAI